MRDQLTSSQGKLHHRRNPNPTSTKNRSPALGLPIQRSADRHLFLYCRRPTLVYRALHILLHQAAPRWTKRARNRRCQLREGDRGVDDVSGADGERRIYGFKESDLRNCVTVSGAI